MSSGDESLAGHDTNQGETTASRQQNASCGGTDSPAEEVTDPGKGLPDSSDVSDDLRATFWALVIVIKLGIIATTLGVLFVAFDNRWDLGGSLLCLGLVLFGFALVRYRRFRAREAGDTDETTG